jgi:hypothetical protein
MVTSNTTFLYTTIGGHLPEVNGNGNGNVGVINAFRVDATTGQRLASYPMPLHSPIIDGLDQHMVSPTY